MALLATIVPFADFPAAKHDIIIPLLDLGQLDVHFCHDSAIYHARHCKKASIYLRWLLKECFRLSIIIGKANIKAAFIISGDARENG